LQIGKQFVVSTQVEQQLNNTRTQLLWDLLANPAGKHGEQAYNLQQLIAEYPQSGLLYALLVHTTDGEHLKEAAAYANPKVLYKLTHDADNLALVSAGQVVRIQNSLGSASFFHSIEPEIIGNDEFLAPWAGEEDFAIMPEIAEAPHIEHPPVTEAEPIAETSHGQPIEEAIHEEIMPVESELPVVVEEPQHDEPIEHAQEEAPVAENELPVVVEHSAEELPQEVIEEKPEEDLPVVEHHNEIADLPPLTEQKDSVLEQIPYDEIAVTEPELSLAEAPKAEEEPVKEEEDAIEEEIIPQQDLDPYFIGSIEDDVYDEIVSIDDINLANEEIFAKPDEEQEEVKPYVSPFADALTEEQPKEEEQPKKEPAAERKIDADDEAEKLIMNNIVSTDFFGFDKAFGDHKEAIEVAPEPQPVPVTAEPEPMLAIAAETKAPVKEQTYITVSKYNDEKMPYSFMWWLDKTRKEHSGIYQPFVEFKLDTTQKIKQDAPDELQQQYAENIFHLASVEDLEKSVAGQHLTFDPKLKEDKIIERFIQEVPQIKPQTGDKLDNENKAKKSSEDQADLVTETLAQIYTDQMLYPKAIATYKKLMLKFPEKSRYFASQIGELEKKTN
jgi:hypothetical protein